MTGTIIPPVVVLGAAGVIGRGVVAAALDGGRPVIAVDRDPAGLTVLAAAHPQADLTPLPGSANADADAAALAAVLRGLDRPLAGVVATLDPGLLRGRLLDLPVAQSCLQFEATLAPQLAAARHLLPLLAQQGRAGGYVLIGGPGGEHPWAGYGHRSVSEATLRMLARVLHCEARSLGVRLQLLSVDTPAWGVHAALPRADWPSAFEIGQRALGLLGSARHGGAVVEFASAPSHAAPDRDLHDARALLGTLARAQHHEVSP